MKIKLTITENKKNGYFWVKANQVEFTLLRTGDGKNEYLEASPPEFPFRKIKLRTHDVSMDVLETMVAKELANFTMHCIDI